MVRLLRKMLLLGNEGVGKTSLVNRFVHNSFKKGYSKTIGTEFLRKTLTFEDNDTIIELLVWDLAGDEYWKKLRASFYLQSRGAFLVFDVTTPQSLMDLINWHHEVTTVLDYSIPFIVLANKIDLESNIDAKLLSKFKQKADFDIIYTSAKTSENVNDAFHSLGKLMIQDFLLKKNTRKS